MTQTEQVQVTDGMIIEWDVPIDMDDGVQLQDLYIDHDGLIARHDYAPEILGGTPGGPLPQRLRRIRREPVSHASQSAAPRYGQSRRLAARSGARPDRDGIRRQLHLPVTKSINGGIGCSR